MTRNKKQAVQERIREKLLSLDEQERDLMVRILRIERDNLHLRKPHLKQELLKAVREVIK